MRYDPGKHQRKTIRLPEYDYSLPGFYFVTIVTFNRVNILGEIFDGTMRLSVQGTIVKRTWMELPSHFHFIEVDEFCLMPNHIHGIIRINDQPQQGSESAGVELFEIIRAFKSFSSRRINAVRQVTGVPVWQRNYYEHVIRDEVELEQIRAYINTNPERWYQDEYGK